MWGLELIPCIDGDQLNCLLHISGKLRRKVCPPAVQIHCRKSLVQTCEEGSRGHWGVSGRSANWSDKQAISICCSLTLWVKRSNCPFSQELDTHWPNLSITYLSITGLKSLYYTHLQSATFTRSRNHREWPIDLSDIMNNLCAHIWALIDWPRVWPQADRIV